MFVSYFPRRLNVDLKILPNIRFSPFAEYPVFSLHQISGRPDIRQNQYPVHPK
jgi:hypothetical protein